MSLDFREVNEEVAELAVLQFFPAEPAARAAIVRIVGEMATDISQVRWLVRRMTSGIYNEWPGPRELRACFISKYRPADGISAFSEVYPDGIPLEHPQAVSAVPALPPGHVASADPQLESMIHTAAAAVQMPPGNYLVGRREKEFAAFLEEVITAPCDRTDPAPKKATLLPETPPVGADGQFVQVVVDVPEEPPRKPITQADVNAILAERRKAAQV